MVATVSTESWDAAWTSTDRAQKKKWTDNIFDDYPTLEYMKSSAMVEFEDGGSEIAVPLLYGKNEAEWFEGYDNVNTAPVDGLTQAFFQWRFITVPITISFTEEQKARKGRLAKKLLATKAEQSLLTIRDAISAAIFSSASGKAMLGLQDIIKDTTSTGTLGGIDRSTASWWNNYSNTNGGNFNDLDSEQTYTGVNAMATAFNNVSYGNSMPKRIVTTLTLYSEWQQINISAAYARTTTKNASGFDMDKSTFMGAVVDFDRDCASGHMYFLNPKALKLKIMRGMNFSKTKFKEPTDGFSKVAFIIVGLQVVPTSLRSLGVVQFT